MHHLDLFLRLCSGPHLWVLSVSFRAGLPDAVLKKKKKIHEAQLQPRALRRESRNWGLVSILLLTGYPTSDKNCHPLSFHIVP